MTIHIPRLALVALVGPSGAGKTTFAGRHFRPTEVVSSDACRALLSDDPNDQTVTPRAFALLHHLAGERLALGRLTVIDATSVRPKDRAPLVALARQYHCPVVAIVLDTPEAVCLARNRGRAEREVAPAVVRRQRVTLRRSLRGLAREGFQRVFAFDRPEAVDAVTVERVPLACDRSGARGPFDIVGDVHGCYDELEALLERLGYARGPAGFAHPDGRTAVFVGDLVDRGPRVLDTLNLVRQMVESGAAHCVPGNHEVRLRRVLAGHRVKPSHGLAETLAELESLPEAERVALDRFLGSLPAHLVLDGGRLVVAHAGLPAAMHGRAGGRVRAFALFGVPDWARDERGPATVVHGHTAVPEPVWTNGTVNVDTGCVYGGRLTALRYPEMQFASVPAARVYFEPTRPLVAVTASDVRPADELTDAADVSGERVVSTRLRGGVRVRAAHAAAALESLSRFGADPRWLVYLPPTMSPAEAGPDPGPLERPESAFAYYRARGVRRVVCQEKHMGSRAVVVACRDADAARSRFGVATGETGTIVTRTGRPFFADAGLTDAVLSRLRAALSASGTWEALNTDWVVLDCELMPWSAKARHLLQTQYAAVGSAGRAALGRVAETLALAQDRLAGAERGRVEAALSVASRRREDVGRFAAAYRRYCWPVASAADLRLAPFHLLASAGAAHVGRDHAWHLETLGRACDADPEWLTRTQARAVDVDDPASVAEAVAWWEALTAAGGEGVVVKPAEFVSRGEAGLNQPALKVRGPEYLRLIYGPDYDAPENLPRLRRRRLSAKRRLAADEFALGVEGLERLARGEPLSRVHECVYAVLALESEPVDPRL